MGGSISKKVEDTTATIKEDATKAIMMSKLADLKVKKTERDMQLAMRMAVLRDRVHWLLAFYGTMIAVNAIRLRRFGIVDKRLALGSFEPMPFAYIPYVATPFLFTYQADFAYGTKAERLNVETQNILKNES